MARKVNFPHLVGVNLSADHYTTLKAIAEKEDRSVSQMVRRIIKLYFNEDK